MGIFSSSLSGCTGCSKPYIELTAQDVKNHNSATGEKWVILHDHVFDLTKFAKRHPGGQDVITDVGLFEASNLFNLVHDDSYLFKLRKEFIGPLKKKF